MGYTVLKSNISIGLVTTSTTKEADKVGAKNRKQLLDVELSKGTLTLILWETYTRTISSKKLT